MEYFHQVECGHFIWITLNDRLSSQFWGKKNTYKRLGPFKRTTRRLFEHKEKDTDLEED